MSQEKNGLHSPDPLQELTASGNGLASQNDPEKPRQDKVLATAVTSSPANPASLAIEALSQRKVGFRPRIQDENKRGEGRGGEGGKKRERCQIVFFFIIIIIIHF